MEARHLYTLVVRAAGSGVGVEICQVLHHHSQDGVTRKAFVCECPYEYYSECALSHCYAIKEKADHRKLFPLP